MTNKEQKAMYEAWKARQPKVCEHCGHVLPPPVEDLDNGIPGSFVGFEKKPKAKPRPRPEKGDE